MSREADSERHRARVSAEPGDRVAWHNLAAAEGDLGRMAEAEQAARRAIALGIAAPETRLVLARALQSQGRLDEAERLFEEALARRPAYVDAHRDLAQLRWMRTGDAAAALVRLDAALAAHPREAELHLVRSIVLHFADDAARALEAAREGLRCAPASASLRQQAARLLIEQGAAGEAAGLAREAVRAAPGESAPAIALCEALLAGGGLEEADALLHGLRRSAPLDQYVLALQATLWRLVGDPRYRTLHDYGAFVRRERLDTPRGWPSLAAFLADLAADLEALHPFHAHPLQQSVRGGSQRTLLAAELARPAVAALFHSIHAAIERHVRALGTGKDPLRSRNTGRFALSGAWSVRLRSGGHHTDHVHPHGWISSACHIAVPAVVREDGPGRAGWLRLGQPPIPTQPGLEAEHFVKPEPGVLVLFPAYMWHGVVPFESAEPRLSVAFDVVPLPA